MKIATQIEKVRIPNAIVKINEKGEFLTSILNSILNANTVLKRIDVYHLTLELIQNYALNLDQNTQ